MNDKTTTVFKTDKITIDVSPYGEVFVTMAKEATAMVEQKEDKISIYIATDESAKAALRAHPAF